MKERHKIIRSNKGTAKAVDCSLTLPIYALQDLKAEHADLDLTDSFPLPVQLVWNLTAGQPQC